MARLSIRSRYSLTLLIAAICILAVGVAFKPKKKPVRTPSESDMSRIRQLSEQRRLNDLSEYLGNAADAAGSALLFLKSAPHTAVFVGDGGKVVTAGHEAINGEDAIDSTGNVFELAPVPTAADVPFTFALVPAANRTTLAAVTAPPQVFARDWVIAVARDGNNEPIYSYGAYQGITNATCGSFSYQRVNSGVPLSPAMLGGGLFTMEGQLLGVITDCHGEPVIASIGSVRAVARQPIPVSERLLAAYGFGVHAAANSNAVQVTSVWDGSLADNAGMRPGDVLLETDGRAVKTAADLQNLADNEARTEHVITATRGRRKVTLRLAARPDEARTGVAADGGMTIAPAKDGGGVLVRAVAAGGPAAHAGIRPGDLVTAIDRRRVTTPEQAAKLLARASSGAAILNIDRHGSRAEVLLPK